MKFFGKEISGRFTIPPGIICTEVPVLERVGRDIPQIGILTTKSIGREPREGNREPIVHCLYEGRPGTFINAVGLRNPGADAFAEKLSRIKLPADRFLLASVFGATPKDMCYVVERLDPYVDGHEGNFGCPHSPGHGAAIGHDPDSIYNFIREMRKVTKKPIIAKLSPNTDEIEAIAKAAMRAGADGIAVINTVGPKVYTIDGHPILTSPVGGSLSGPGIKERGLEIARRTREAIGPGVPMGAMGGISVAKDARDYSEAANPDFFGVGTALAGMSTKTMVKYFAALERDLEYGTNDAEQYLVFNKSGHKKFRVWKNEKLAEDLHEVTLDGGFDIEPGQFIFAWIPGVGEKPYSLIEENPVKIIVQKRKTKDGYGIFSSALAEIEEGREMYLRGPCGDPVELKGMGNAVLVGGGTGIAALYPILKRLSERGYAQTCFLGAKDKAHLFYADRFAKNSMCFVTTDDGSAGKKGFVTEYLERMSDLVLKGKDAFFNCGPSPMVRAAESIEMRYAPKEKIFSSEEEMTRCGYGLCGASAREDGLRRCVDGYFMNPI